MRVLVVDDSKFMAKAIKSVLESLDLDVVGLAHDGLQALEMYKAEKPEVTLLDITMPVMDGVECLTKLREEFPEANVVMLSAIRDPSIVEQCLALGAKGFLEKPIKGNNPADVSKLLNALENAVAEKV